MTSRTRGARPLADHLDPKSVNNGPHIRRYLTDEPVSETTDTIDEGILEDREHFDPASRRFNDLYHSVQPRSLFEQSAACEMLKYDVLCAQRSGPVYTIRKAAS